MSNLFPTDYYRDFSTLNIPTIPPYFTEPTLPVGKQGMIPIPDRAALVAVCGPVMEGLRAKGYSRSELELALRSGKYLSLEKRFVHERLALLEPGVGKLFGQFTTDI